MKTHLFRTLFGAIAIAGLGTVVLRAEDASPQAKRLIAMIDFSKTAKDQAKVAFAPLLERFKKQGIPEEGIKEISEAAERFFAKTFDDPAIADEMAKVYDKSFSPQEIEQLLAFYESPVGHKSLKMLPQVMAECNKVGQQFAKTNQEAFQAELRTLI
ncbi:MAG: DUF2059 domain-containing protein, partial [Luteolibacter sp.]